MPFATKETGSRGRRRMYGQVGYNQRSSVLLVDLGWEELLTWASGCGLSVKRAKSRSVLDLVLHVALKFD